LQRQKSRLLAGTGSQTRSRSGSIILNDPVSNANIYRGVILRISTISFARGARN
jgi:predicted secreted protein